MDDVVLYSVSDRLCTITLNRPEKLNALNAESFRQLANHLARLDLPEISCLLREQRS